MKTTHVKVVSRSYVVYVSGEEELRTDLQKAASEYYHELARYFAKRGYKEITKMDTETAIAEIEVARHRYPKSSYHGEKAGKTYYRIYVNDDFVKELSFNPKDMTLINAVAPDLDWKKIED